MCLRFVADIRSIPRLASEDGKIRRVVWLAQWGCIRVAYDAVGGSCGAVGSGRHVGTLEMERPSSRRSVAIARSWPIHSAMLRAAVSTVRVASRRARISRFPAPRNLVKCRSLSSHVLKTRLSRNARSRRQNGPDQGRFGWDFSFVLSGGTLFVFGRSRLFLDSRARAAGWHHATTAVVHGRRPSYCPGMHVDGPPRTAVPSPLVVAVCSLGTFRCHRATIPRCGSVM